MRKTEVDTGALSGIASDSEAEIHALERGCAAAIRSGEVRCRRSGQEDAGSVLLCLPE
uniref:hypothetical protein n=1 Tax=Rhodococcus qingshengii TaxID=334542 RepID=UPI001C4DE2B6|nr:hypothetical protein [Rhodococcus qingshengii]